MALSWLSALKRSRDGNIAMMTGLLLFPILMGVGFALDMQRTNGIAETLQQSADAGLLAAVRNKLDKPSMTLSEVEALAKDYFQLNQMKNNKRFVINKFEVTYDASKSKYRLNMDVDVRTTILAAIGRSKLNRRIVNEVVLGKPPYLELAMVLDNTGSMNGNGKLTTLKTAAENLVTSLFSHPDAEVKIGIVPFAQYVSVGTGYSSASWLDTSAAPGGSFSGCVGSRAYPANIEDDGYATNPIPGLGGAPCPDDMLPLTDNETTLVDAIKAMDGNGWTYIPAGLVWGWRMLSPEEPLTEGVTLTDLKNREGYKAIILMTDGENTKSPDYPTHNNANQADANSLTEQLCEAIKDDEIIIYSIAFEVTDATIKYLLEDCAETPNHYFDAKNAAELTAAFSAIADSLRNISLAK